ncbi:hypothetical protein NDU88_005484 [Pleurodeles waltl]|uniref:Uncharacterized protein n=1 Tax=Pleurodeles waltl TaxID=8319 RepID=A0AAV7RKA0_PLEWA|nr:hypothetical protein NDU88_005484 [Pleurodeles waltl]
MGQIPLRLQDLEERVSDLKYRSSVWDTELGKILKMLSESQTKMEEIENYVRRSHLRFEGIPEEAGNHQAILQFMEDLIKTYILDNPLADWTIM